MVNGMLGAACLNDDQCTIAGQVCNVATATPVCVSTVGGACPNGNVDCPLTRQQCDLDIWTGAPICLCEPGWAPDVNGACNDWPAGFCGGVDGGCGLGMGDCNDNNDCTGPLVCGVNNCGGIRPLADCCVDPSDPTGQGADTPCDGSAPNVWGCCTPENPCGVNQGDCDTDADCGLNANGDQLWCVPDSCSGDGFSSVFPAGQTDCCQDLFYSNFEEFQDRMDNRIERWTNDEEPARPQPKY